MTFYRRRLPHWQPENATIFVTWRLYGTLPGEAKCEKSIKGGKEFVEWDRKLDAAEEGPRWLADDRIAQIVVDTLQFCEQRLQLYELRAYVVMCNHVHILIQTSVRLSKIMKSIKGFTSREANALLGRVGQPFWQDESFDHWARTEAEARKIAGYIESNPVKAGLVTAPEQWRWSSAAVGQASRPAVS